MSGLKRMMIGLAFLVGVGPAGAQQAGPWSLEACIQYAVTNSSQVQQSPAGAIPDGHAADRAGVNHAYNAGRSINPFT